MTPFFCSQCFTTRLLSKMEKDTRVMNIRKIGMRPMSQVSSSTHGAGIRKVSTRDAFTRVRKYPDDPKKLDSNNSVVLTWNDWTPTAIQVSKLSISDFLFVSCCACYSYLVTYLRQQVKNTFSYFKQVNVIK